MANASAKRIAQQNAETIKNLRLGMLGSGVLSLLLRLVFRTGSLSLSKMPIWLYALSMVPALFLSRYLERIGSPRRDPITGTLISSGEDLARPGILEWCFDVIYITWACQVGSGAFGEWFWWVYLVIPVYALFKLWISMIAPMLPMIYRRFAPASTVENKADVQEPLSKRQEKLRKRGERGDPRVRTQSTR
ncbi:hypothetical protein AcW1_004559 [Taiwanofungus camphoratus]|nr:hypothetical protein AcV5_000944 [Antrodia cinnamomea]KAI0952485.1 hypothetical protein AcV7_008274 [Antrodia cinnamomea]KAI0959858.1 hypothetical protein AcW1_004559 [Antrodia cinnamomea]